MNLSSAPVPTFAKPVACMSDSVTKLVGRPRVHSSNAEKQAAYRLRHSPVYTLLGDPENAQDVQFARDFVTKTLPNNPTLLQLHRLSCLVSTSQKKLGLSDFSFFILQRYLGDLVQKA